MSLNIIVAFQFYIAKNSNMAAIQIIKKKPVLCVSASECSIFHYLQTVQHGCLQADDIKEKKWRNRKQLHSKITVSFLFYFVLTSITPLRLFGFCQVLIKNLKPNNVKVL